MRRELPWEFILESNRRQRYRKKDLAGGHWCTGVPNNRLINLVKERGVKFQLTPEAERQLRLAGAYEKLILTIREVAP